MTNYRQSDGLRSKRLTGFVFVVDDGLVEKTFLPQELNAGNKGMRTCTVVEEADIAAVGDSN